MKKPTPPPDRGPGLNPSLKTTMDDAYDTAHSTRPPVETASVQREEGRAWPIIWLVVFLICVALALYILID